MFNRCRRLFFSFFLVAITISASHSLELSVNRIAYNLLELNRNYLDVIVSVSSKDDIQEASVSVGILPFVLLDVQSLDSNFRVTYQNASGVLHLNVHRVAPNTEPNTEWIQIKLSKGREKEAYYSDFGLFPILDAKIIDRLGALIPNNQVRHGGWIYHGGDESTLEFHSLPVRVVDKNNNPAARVLVIYELIGRAGIAMGRMTNERGVADFIHPPDTFFPKSVYPPLEEIQSPFDCESFVNQSSFTGMYVSNGCFTARFIVFPTADNTSFSEYYVFNHTVCSYSGVGLNFAEETLILGDSSSGVKNWCLYP